MEDGHVVADVPGVLPHPVSLPTRETRLRNLLKAKGFMVEPPPAPEPKRGRSPPPIDAHRKGWREVFFGQTMTTAMIQRQSILSSIFGTTS